jgi:hypothetical protein
MKRIGLAGAALFALCASAQEPVRVEVNVVKDELKVLRDDLQRIVVEARTGGQALTMVTSGKGAPYSGEEVTEFSQTLGDGTRIQRQDKVTVYRDSQGRSRRETPNQITITDPVEGVSYTLDPATLTGRKTAAARMVEARYVAELDDAAKVKLGAKEKSLYDAVLAAKGQGAVPPPPPPPGAASSARATQSAQAGAVKTPVTSASSFYYVSPSAGAGGSGTTLFYSLTRAEAAGESLGQRNIDGILAEGTRTTETIPVGAIGNDRPIVVVSERWFSPELNTVVMTRRSDPRTGEETFRLTNVRQGDPSPYLFQAPAGYRIADPAGSATPAKTPFNYVPAPPPPPPPAQR